MSATVTAAEARAQAIRRLQARNRPATYRTIAGPDGNIKVQTGGGAGTGFLPAATLGEFLDDALVRMTVRGPVADVVATIVTAARSGAAAAAAAVCKVRQLGEHDQFTAYTVLAGLSSDLPEAAQVLREVRAEWKRLRLPVVRPSGAPQLERPGYVATNAPPGTGYSPGFPAEWIPEWVKR
jgi:hypothetical protein